MPVIKSTPVTKIINGLLKKTSVSSLVILSEYETEGEDAIIIKDKPCTVKLNSSTTEHITIKAMVDTLVIGDYLIDDEFNEIELQKGASIELRFFKDCWYIMSSDGLKNS